MSTRRSPLYWLVARSRAFVWRDLLFETSYKLQSVFRLANVLFQVLIFYFLARMIGGEGTSEHLERYGDDYFTFALVGIAFTGLFNAGLINFTTSIRQQLMAGVLEAMAATPIRSFSLLFYSLLFPLGFEVLKAFFYIAFGALALGADVALVRPGLLAATLALSAVVFGCLGVIAGALIVYFKRGDPLAWFLSSATSLVGGVFFPVSVLPGWLELLAKLVPVTYAVDALRASLIPAASLEHTGRDLAALGVFAIALLPAAWYSATIVIEKARMQGNLGQY